MTDELKPCPFCGGQDVEIVQFDIMLSPDNEFINVRPGLQIECNQCHLACLQCLIDEPENLELEREKLIRAWNRRVSERRKRRTKGNEAE